MHSIINVSDNNFGKYWQQLLGGNSTQRVESRARDSGARFMLEQRPRFEDFSFMVVENEQPVFGCSITTHREKGKVHLGYYGEEASFHINRNCLRAPSNNFDPDALRLLENHVTRLIDKLRPDSIQYIDPLTCGMMSPVTQVFLSLGAVPEFRKIQLLSLGKSELELSRAISKRYRSYIHWGRDQLDLASETLEGVIPRKDRQTQFSTRKHLCEGPDVSGLFTTGSMAGKTVASVSCGNTSPLIDSVVRKAGLSGKAMMFEEYSVQPFFRDQPVIHALLWHAIQQSRKLGFEYFLMSHNPVILKGQPFELNVSEFGGECQDYLVVSL